MPVTASGIHVVANAVEWTSEDSQLDFGTTLALSRSADHTPGSWPDGSHRGPGFAPQQRSTRHASGLAGCRQSPPGWHESAYVSASPVVADHAPRSPGPAESPSP